MSNSNSNNNNDYFSGQLTTGAAGSRPQQATSTTSSSSSSLRPRRTTSGGATASGRQPKPRAPPPPPGSGRGRGSSGRGRGRGRGRGGRGTTTKARPRPTAAAGRPAAPVARSRPTAQTAPAVSRPVGSYYASSPSSGGGSSGSYYGNTAAATNSGAPTSAAAAAPVPSYSQWAAPSASSQPASNSWAVAPVPAPAAVSSSSDWYSPPPNDATAAVPNTTTTTTTTTNNNNNNMYAGSQSNSMYSNNAMQPQQAQQQQPFLSGSMDSGAPTGTPAPTILQPQQFIPRQPSSGTGTMSHDMDFENEPPLLEELGINIQHIYLKTKAVVLPFSRFGGDQINHHQICQDADLVGPVAFCLLLGGEMVLTGKLQFGYIYGFALLGCLSMTLVVNLMSPSDAISFWTVASILGYALIPVNVLGVVKIIVINLVKLQTLGRILGILTVAWSTTASTRLFELGCGLRGQRYLIAYPIALLYSAFVMITIF